MRQSTKRILSLLLTGAFFIAAVVVYVNLIKPKYGEIQQLRASFAAKSHLFDEQKKIISQVQDLLAQYQGTPQLQEAVSLALPLDEDTAGLFQQLFAISRLNGLNMQSVALSALAIKPSGLGTLRVELKLRGGYDSLKSFLAALETNIRVMDLSRLRIQPVDSKGMQDLFVYDLTVETYYQQ